MKKILIYVIALTIFGCSDSPEETPQTLRPERQTMNLNIILNETTSPGSSAYIPNRVFYRSSSMIDLSQTVGIEKITIHSITLKVLRYNCSLSEIDGKVSTVYPYRTGVLYDNFPFTVKEDYSGTVTQEQFLKGMATQLLKKGVSDIDFQTALPQDITDFEIELSIDIDMTLEFHENL